MDIYDAIIVRLMSKNIVFNAGLKPYEICEIEDFYNFRFPAELKKLYSKGLPVSKGFYNWRDRSDKNIKLLSFMLNNPIEEIKQDLRDGFIWCDRWGIKPEKFEDSSKVMLRHYECAPKLIPVYSHRYIPSMEEPEMVPILSVHGSDIIYYASDLISYLEIEFAFRKYDAGNNAQYIYIPFWSDLL